MNLALDYFALGAVVLSTILIGAYGLRVSRTTSDFYVASRTVSPWLNASAIGGEYLSAASFLGIAGLIFAQGARGFWFPIGYTAGYLLLLLFVAAPLRRSRAYTVPDFTEARLESARVRRVTSALVVIIGWLYIVPQLQGAALTLSTATGLPDWSGAVAVAVIVGGIVAVGGMRSITFVQAFQYWLKLTALAVPAFALFIYLGSGGETPNFVTVGDFTPYGDPESLVTVVSLLVALLLGTMGLPHVLVRFYTNPDGQAARTTTVIVLVLISLFYLFPTLLGLLGRVVMPSYDGPPDALVLLLPNTVIPGALGDALASLVLAGAFAAFLSTSSGLAISLAGVISQEFAGGTVRGFRMAALASTLVPLVVSLVLAPGNLAGSVGLVFAFTASTIAPVLVLSIWWRGLTARGAISGMVVGGATSAIAIVASLGQPAIVTVPIAFATALTVSWIDRRNRPRGTERFLTRIHTPD